MASRNKFAVQQPVGTVSNSPQPVYTAQAISSEPISVVYWGYWKAFGDQKPVTAETGPTGATSPAVGVKPTKQPIDSLGNKVRIGKTSASSLLYSLSPASGATAGLSKLTSPKASQTATQTSSLTQSEIIQGVSGIVTAFKANGWTDQSIINYFLVPGQLGYKQFPGLTPTIFIQAVGSTINVSSISTKQNK